MTSTNILIAEDNIALCGLIAKSLKAEGYAVEMVHDGQDALQALSSRNHELLILDLDLPSLRGPDVLAKLRTTNREISVLILTAIDHIDERVARLDGGADDYLTKPVSLKELSARVRALLRRGKQQETSILRIADLEMDRIQRKVTRAGRPVELTIKEFSLLEYFMRNAGREITRNMLIEEVWNLTPDTVTNVVDVYVNYLRKKIDEYANVKLINTVRGVGFRFGTPLETTRDKMNGPAELPAG